MRSLFLAAALSFASLPATVHVADACGGYVQRRPAALAMHTAYVNPDLPNKFVFTGATLDATQAKKLRFERIDTMSYDWTEIAPAPALAQPLVFTVVGPSGTQLVKSAKTVWVKPGFGEDKTIRQAVVVPRGNYEVAFAGNVAATWSEFQVINGDAVTSFNHGGTTLTVQLGGRVSIGQLAYDGWPLGVVTVARVRYAALSSHRAVHLVEI